ncbi:MAG: DinB family protein, partial [Longimicrobiales bacterium]
MNVTTTSEVEAWLGGPVAGVSAALQPAAHAFVQARRDLERVVLLVEPHELWVSVGGAASIGFHL